MVQSLNQTSPEAIKIIAITIETERFGDGFSVFLAGSANKSPIASDLVIYEDIFESALTGELYLLDDQNLILNIKGSERVRVIYQPFAEETNPVEKIFFINAIESVQKISENQAVLKLSLIESYGYYNNLKKINVGYQSSGEEMISKITEEQINKPMLTKSAQIVANDTSTHVYKPSYQQDFRYIVPWLTPFKAINQILKKMTTEDGMPYFYFSTLASENQVLTDFSSILQKRPFNRGKPFVYSASYATSQELDLIEQSLIVENYEAYELSNTMLLAQLGAITSRIEAINASTGNTFPGTINMQQELKSMEQNGVFDNFGDRQRLQLFDDITTIVQGNDEVLTGLTSHVNFILETRNTHPEYDKNVLSFNQSVDLADSRLKIISYAILRYLIFNMVTIKVPGLLFSMKNLKTSVGNLLDMAVIENEANQIREKSLFSRDKSGQFLIMRKKHMFDLTSLPENHTVQLDISKIADLSAGGR